MKPREKHRAVRTKLEEMSNERLMKMFQEGVEEAFTILYKRFDIALQSSIERIVRDRTVAEDIVQEAWVRVIRNRHSYDPIAQFSTWLYTIAKRLAFSELRRRRTHGPHDSIHQVNSEGEEYMDHLPSDEHPIDHELHWSLICERIQEEIDRIPDPFKEPLVLCDIQELPYKQIAEITGDRLGTVKSRIHRGRSFLRDRKEHIMA